MPHYTPLISDFGFKVMFGNDANTDFLRRALQALIKSAVPLAEVQLLPDEQTKFTANSRRGIYALACTDEAGSFYIVKM